MRQIPLTRGKFALVDDDMFDFLSQFKWLAIGGRPTWYAGRGISTGIAYKGRTIYMHRLIIDAPEDMQVDHIDGNGLNNTRSNLRLATPAENRRNLTREPISASGYKGVYRVYRKWRAMIQVNRKSWHLGYFDSAEEAARAYDAAAIIHHGEFASLNFKEAQA